MCSTATFTDLLPLGRKDHLAPGNGIDPSDRDGEIRIADWPVPGMYQPDGFDAYEVGGSTYLVTANEGDGRDDWGDYEETTRASNLTLCEDAFAGFVDGSDRVGSVAELTAARNLGRLNVSTAEGQRGAEGCYEELHVLGARSFSIWTADGELVFDSGDDFERIAAAAVPEFFNSNHRENSFETRSDDKGPEPEDVAIAWLDGRAYAFVVLERIGGVMVYDLTDPTAPQFVRYVNNRDFTAVPGTSQAGDLGAENVIVIAAEDSPIGQPLLAVANEVSGTTTLFRIGIADRTPPFGGGVADACRDARGPQARSCASPPARGRG